MDKKLYDEDLEHNIITSMLLNNDCFERAIEKGIKKNDFYFRDTSRSFELMIDKNTNDPVAIMGWLDGEEKQSIKEAIQLHISDAPFDSWLELLLDKSAHRKLYSLSVEIPEIVSQEGTIETKIDQINSKIHENKVHKKFGSPQSVRDIIPTVIDSISNASTDQDKRIYTGFGRIDNDLQGFRNGDLVIIAGRPAMGKTTFALNIAANNLFKDKTVLVFSLEMTNEQLIKKMISADAEIHMQSFLTGGLTDDEWKKFNQSTAKFNDQHLYCYDVSPITIETLINKTKSIASSRKIDLIVIDYLQLLMTSSKAPSNSDSRAASMTYISNLLKGLAKEISCPLIALSQLNRGVEARVNDRRPILSDLRDSGSIEQDADLVLMLYRDGYYSDDPNDKSVEVICRKNRMGKVGTFNLCFEGAESRFYEAEMEAFGDIYNLDEVNSPI